MIFFHIKMLDNIKLLFENNDESIELEVRFGYFDKSNFKSNIKLLQFNNIKKYLIQNYKKYIEQDSIVEYDTNNNYRKIIIEDNIIWQMKTKLETINLYEYNCRISKSKEINFKPKEFNTNYIRNRKRFSFNIFDIGKVDLSIINNDTYEFEFEYYGNNIKELQSFIEQFYLIINFTEKIYTTTDKKNLIKDINSNYNVSYKPYIVDILTKARNIKKIDLTYGGIVGNKIKYTISHKADGIRKILVINNIGIWLIYGDEFNLILKKNKNNINTLEKLNLTIIDGELINNNYYLVDCIIYKNDISIQKKDYESRKKILHLIVNKIKIKNYQFEVKESEVIETPKDFFILINKYLKDKPSYPTDGLIFTPWNDEYNSNNSKIPINKRILSNYSDIVKWKPIKDITIDFVIKNNKLWSYDKNLKELVIFKGSNKFPLNYEDVIIDKDVENYVIEYEWSFSKLRPRKIREDKLYPNTLDVAINNWEDIMIPIDENYISGNNLNMTFFYHNRVKSELYSKIKPNSIILDIGSGRGGDISKWKNIKNSKIYAVEPNEDNLYELKNRLKSYDFEDNVTIINTKGENYKEISRIVKEKVDVISMMLSLSFFKDNNLKDLIKTIENNLKKGGILIFLTIDGNSIEQLFNPVFGGKKRKEININISKLILNNDNTLTIKLPNTIVEEQTEFLVFIKELEKECPNLILTEFNRCNKEKLLNESNLLFSSLYSYGIMKYN